MEKIEYKVGQHYRCPECRSLRAKIIWISEDGKTIAVKCPCSHFVKVARIGGQDTPVHKQNCVMLIRLEE